MIHHLIEGRQASVVQIRCGARDLAQRGRLERAPLGWIVRDQKPALVGRTPVYRADTGIVKPLVREVRAAVTEPAIRFAAAVTNPLT